MKITLCTKGYSKQFVNPERTNFMWHMNIVGKHDGFPLLWLHGFMGSSEDWLPLVNEHFPEYRNILVDLPGHGKSLFSGQNNYPAFLDSLRQQLNSLGIKTFIPIGYSMGGRIALHLQQHDPDHIPALVGLSTAPGLKTDQEIQQRRLSDTELMNKLDKQGFNTFLSKWYKFPLFQSISKDKELLNNLTITRSFNNPGQLRQALDLFGTAAMFSLWEKLPEIDIPVLLISGSKDSKYCNINREMVTLLSRGDHQIIENADHAFHLEKPLETAHLIRHFLRESIEGV